MITEVGDHVWTVMEMIEFLQKCNPDAICTIGYDGTFGGPHFVDPEIREEGKEVLLGSAG